MIPSDLLGREPEQIYDREFCDGSNSTDCVSSYLVETIVSADLLLTDTPPSCLSFEVIKGRISPMLPPVGEVIPYCCAF